MFLVLVVVVVVIRKKKKKKKGQEDVLSQVHVSDTLFDVIKVILIVMFYI